MLIFEDLYLILQNFHILHRSNELSYKFLRSLNSTENTFSINETFWFNVPFWFIN